MKLVYWLCLFIRIEIIQFINCDLADGIVDARTGILEDVESGIEDTVDIIVNTSPADVHLYYYNISNIDKPQVVVTLNNVTDLYEIFNPAKETLISVHGWRNDYDSDYSVTIKSAVLSKHDINFINVDWPAHIGYVYAVNSVSEYGRYTGEFVNDLCETFNYDFLNVKLVGHSLGAHYCGAIGKTTNKKVRYIVGLDPAGPMYNLEMDNDKKLSPKDATNVQIIHTNCDMFGIKTSSGVSDFWPNGGCSQPQCGFLDRQSCSHAVSYKLYAASLTSTTDFVAIRYFKDDDPVSYNASIRAVMGEFDLDPRARGDYYLKTDTKKPFALGTSWISKYSN